MHRFGLAVDDSQLITVPARILPAPMLSFGHNNTLGSIQPHPQNANWNLRDATFSDNGRLAVVPNQQRWQQCLPVVTGAALHLTATLNRHGI